MESKLPQEIADIILEKATKRIKFLGAEFIGDNQLVFEFGDGSSIILSERGVNYIPPSMQGSA